MKTITESHNWTQFRNQWTVKSPALLSISATKFLHLWFREHPRREGRKTMKARISESLLWDCHLWKWLSKEDLNKDNINRHSNAEKRKYHEDKRTTGNAWLLREELVSHRYESPDCLLLLKHGGHSWSHIHTDSKNELSKLYLCICVYTQQ